MKCRSMLNVNKPELFMNKEGTEVNKGSALNVHKAFIPNQNMDSGLKQTTN